jgi:alpha-ketoglutarate-dependent taurine dioxygenase
LLYCESAGQNFITTDLADVSSTLNVLNPHDYSMLEKMYRCYVSRSGEQLYKDLVVQKHLDTGQPFLNLCSRGWVQGDADMTLEQMVRTMHALFESIRLCHVHSWSEGDCLVFNNYKYLHRRNNPSNVPDPDRRLIRMWFTSDLS